LVAGDVTSATDLEIAVDDPEAADVRELRARHVAFAREATPPGRVHALDLPALKDLDVTFYRARYHGRLVGVAALKRLDASHAELKSMHTTLAAIGRGAAECYHSFGEPDRVRAGGFRGVQQHAHGHRQRWRIDLDAGRLGERPPRPEVWTVYAASALSAAHVTATRSTGDRQDHLAGDLERPCE
jgi:hypothetical protein